ncbi:hypothetical protein [Mycolicibacter minnesotensis]|nr:hypothetical protein [Mycolicibacter minnesotensis]BBY32638.1 hypothetical protein MMIN_06990 [Mycolicibacter minnesotensis]
MSKTEEIVDQVKPSAQHMAVESPESAAEDAGTLAERAEAEAAEAEAVAARARARAIRLKQQVQGAGSDSDADVTPNAVELGGVSAVESETSWRARARNRVSGFRRRQLATAAVVLCACALLVASGLMVRQQQNVRAVERERAEFVAAARQAVVTLMSIDFHDPQGSVQRIVDNSTGPFREEFLGAADDFSRVAKDAKVTTKATANAAAVQSMTADSAVVLVSASSTVTNAAGAEEAPRRWRLTVDLQREGDQIKMSKVEFVP